MTRPTTEAGRRRRWPIMNVIKNDNKVGREQVATRRLNNEHMAMSAKTRLAIESATSWKNFGRRIARRKGEAEQDEEFPMPPQYTLSSRMRTTHKSPLPFQYCRKKICWFLSRSTLSDNDMGGSDDSSSGLPGGSAYICCIDVNAVVSSYLSFTFRSSYFLLFGSFALYYFSLVLIFATIYAGISAVYPECINSGGVMIGTGEGTHIFGDCFQLSWTTFATVGYGVIYPATGASNFYVPSGCVVVGVLGSFEAYLGVLFAGFCCAILFRKVLRSQNLAQVFFSDPIVVRFGKAELSNREWRDSESSTSNGDMSSSVWRRDGNHTVMMTVDENKEDCRHHDEELGVGRNSSASIAVTRVKDDDDNDNNDKIPCPLLEFRLVNRLHDVPSGEIVEANLDCMAILKNDGSDRKAVAVSATGGQEHSANERTNFADLVTFHSAESKQRNIFVKIHVEADKHPYFSRVWYARHHLDENSPLLTSDARDRVKMAGGCWPADMNNYRDIKNCLQFRHILCFFNGTSNSTAATVYAQKVYDLLDVNVGYRFVPMNYHADNGSLKTDTHLLNCVCQQRGGGSEPF